MAGHTDRKADRVRTYSGLAKLATLTMLAIVVLATPTASAASLAAPGDSPAGVGVSPTQGGFLGSASGPSIRPAAGSGPGVVSQTFDCGPPVPVGHLLINASDFCGQVRNTCAGDPAVNAAGQPVTTYGSRTLGADGLWSL